MNYILISSFATMPLIPNWQAVLRRAWSIRLIVVAALLSGLEVILPLLDIELSPPWALPLLFFLVTAGAFVARLLAQSSLSGE
ncbi:hypothetical protein GCM10007276_34270 [Agaricicola taiwanensis]|uniref:Uncharacterized protein n=1 Tax=Agaricicola taiwanensis TaxID=591372 RepID=A0A8J2YNB9_9RHOB|nr:hypothetical protein [Agaricicola taiwanensis]GGE54331.1 hypothetical protein GCM10007276_34270 [Agaricicola taiwanensis]